MYCSTVIHFAWLNLGHPKRTKIVQLVSLSIGSCIRWNSYRCEPEHWCVTTTTSSSQCATCPGAAAAVWWWWWWLFGSIGLVLRFLMPTAVHFNHLSLDSENFGSFHPYHCWRWPSLRSASSCERGCLSACWGTSSASVRHSSDTRPPGASGFQLFPPVDHVSYPSSPAMGNLWSAPTNTLAGLLSWQ